MGQPPAGCGAEILRERQGSVVEDIGNRGVAHEIKLRVTIA